MDSFALRGQLFRTQDALTSTRGQLSFRAVPALSSEFADKCMRIFSALDRSFTADEQDDFRAVLHDLMEEAYARSHRSFVIVTYETGLGHPMHYSFSSQISSISDTYSARNDAQCFGSQPDARPGMLAAEAPEPRHFRVLDIGAGGGRNTIALARRGHPVDAVEMTPRFADEIRTEAARQSLTVRVIESDIFNARGAIRDDYAMILASELVPEFRTLDQLRALFELAADHLAVGGLLVLNTFVTQDGFTPDETVRQCAQQSLSTIFTPDEISTAAAGLQLQIVSDDNVLGYEADHQPADAWPPTHWFLDWAGGVDVFGPECVDIPVELRWLVYRKI